ncbi:ribbon-helix-helix protein, CopG family [Nocardioides donggukensis]|uniref:ribbon-helix-helix protein, CopG family n=1 Tax=Nocardioides donggukensis TaxID=2774019 RepID=UPI00191E759E
MLCEARNPFRRCPARPRNRRTAVNVPPGRSRPLLPPTFEELAAVDALAERENISRSEAIRRALAGLAA